MCDLCNIIQVTIVLFKNNHLTTLMTMICPCVTVVDVDECSDGTTPDTCDAGQGSGTGR